LHTGQNFVKRKQTLKQKRRPIDPWLNLAKLLPFDEQLPPPADDDENAYKDAFLKSIWRVKVLWDVAARKHPDELPVVVVEFPEFRYALFVKVRAILGACVAVVNDPAVTRPKSPHWVIRDPRLINLELPPAWRALTLTSSGIYLSGDDLGMFLNCLLQTDVWELRACPVCSAPYLPHRNDQKACSPRCANTFRVRRSRSDKKKSA
jgi:predicted nucleic acid-binding Zn ribbon protein